MSLAFYLSHLNIDILLTSFIYAFHFHTNIFLSTNDALKANLRIYFHKSVTLVKDNSKAPFSIATTPRCRGRRYAIPGLLHFTLDQYLIMLGVKQGGIKYHFLSLWYDSTWYWTSAYGPLANTLPIMPVYMHKYIYIYIYIYTNTYIFIFYIRWNLYSTLNTGSPITPLIMLFHNVTGRCQWYGRRGWTFLPITDIFFKISFHKCLSYSALRLEKNQ